MNLKSKLKAIVEKGKGNVTSKDKQFIADLSIKYGVPFEPQKSCDNCYIDQAVVLYGKVEDDEPDNGAVRLRDDIDVVINGIRINNATLTDEIVKKYRGNGLPEHWFV